MENSTTDVMDASGKLLISYVSCDPSSQTVRDFLENGFEAILSTKTHDSNQIDHDMVSKMANKKVVSVQLSNIPDLIEKIAQSNTQIGLFLATTLSKIASNGPDSCKSLFEIKAEESLLNVIEEKFSNLSFNCLKHILDVVLELSRNVDECSSTPVLSSYYLIKIVFRVIELPCAKFIEKALESMELLLDKMKFCAEFKASDKKVPRFLYFIEFGTYKIQWLTLKCVSGLIYFTPSTHLIQQFIDAGLFTFLHDTIKCPDLRRHSLSCISYIVEKGIESQLNVLMESGLISAISHYFGKNNYVDYWFARIIRELTKKLGINGMAHHLDLRQIDVVCQTNIMGDFFGKEFFSYCMLHGMIAEWERRNELLSQKQ